MVVITKTKPYCIELFVHQHVCLLSQGKNAFFRDLTTIQLMPSGDMDPGLVSIRQEVRAGVTTTGQQKKKILKQRIFPHLLPSLLPSPYPSSNLRFPPSSCVQFLLRVLTAWVQAINDPSIPASGNTSPSPPSNGPKADWWPSLCLELGSLLQVNPDILRRHLVCELYSQGLDPRAEEAREHVLSFVAGTH